MPTEHVMQHCSPVLHRCMSNHAVQPLGAVPISHLHGGVQNTCLELVSSPCRTLLVMQALWPAGCTSPLRGI